MWSPHLAPKPKDWGDHIDIVGSFPDPSLYLPSDSARKSSVSDSQAPKVSMDAAMEQFVPSKELVDFLTGGSPPIFVGFGSMVCADMSQLLRIVLRAAVLAGVRVLVQVGWTHMTSAEFKALAEEVRMGEGTVAVNGLVGSLIGYVSWGVGLCVGAGTSGAIVANSTAPSELNSVVAESGVPAAQWSAEDAFLIGEVPHSWLFPRVAAVTHHGGAGEIFFSLQCMRAPLTNYFFLGTTAAGLRAGRPTCIIPFFGDQHFWGEMVHRCKVGPAPLPAHAVTPEQLAAAFRTLLQPDIRSSAESLGKLMSEEDGVVGAVDAFYRQLPVANMLCEVSLLLDESRLAAIKCVTCGLKMSHEVHRCIHRRGSGREDHEYSAYNYVSRLTRKPEDVFEGLKQGVEGASAELFGAFTDMLSTYLRAIYAHPESKQTVVPLASTIGCIINRPVTGGRILYSKVSEGVRNSLGVARAMQPSTSKEPHHRLSLRLLVPGGGDEEDEDGKCCASSEADTSDDLGEDSDWVFCEGAEQETAAATCTNIIQSNNKETDIAGASSPVDTVSDVSECNHRNQRHEEIEKAYAKARHLMSALLNVHDFELQEETK